MAVMRKSVPLARIRMGAGWLACAAALAGAAACSPAPEEESLAPAPEPVTEQITPSVTHDSGLPADAMPDVAREGMVDCPYLDTQFVAETNGQKVTASGTDTRFDTPACVYWSYPEDPQLEVIVRHTGSEEEARKVVDHAAPVDITDPAEQPAGWSGGRAGGGVVPGREGAVYAVAKDTVAVVVLTNQKESVKAQLIAEQAITNLSL